MEFEIRKERGNHTRKPRSAISLVVGQSDPSFLRLILFLHVKR